MSGRLPIWLLLVSIFACAFHLAAQTGRTESRIVLRGNTHPLARAEFDRGAAPESLPMDRMQLVLKQSPAQEADLKKFLADLQDKSSSNYHKWLTPQQFGERFGASQSDIAKVTAWLTANGFTVNKVSAGRTSVEFSGTAAQVRDTFSAEIHKFSVNGEDHWANASDPQIPAAFSSIITGIATLHNFTAKPQHRIAPDLIEARMSAKRGAKPEFTNGSAHGLAPADVQTIYNASAPNPNAISIIGIVGRSNINKQDVEDFFYVFGLPEPNITITVNGPDPGDLGGAEEVEAVLDTTWSAAMAGGSNLVVSQTTNATDGILLSEIYIIDNYATLSMSESFGLCEAALTAAQESHLLLLSEQAAAEGITYLVAAGDSGSAGCDDPNTSPATGPISVNGLGSSPFVLSVGGTQFNENGTPSTYWDSTNSANGGSALSYIPEDVWNESGASDIYAGGGGRSIFFSKPEWQAGVPGIPADGARDVPDISLTAALHDPYLLCLDGSCYPARQGDSFGLYAVGGTSAATPTLAGILRVGSGQIAPQLYALAAQENFSQCNGSFVGGLPAANCIFNDVTVGNNAVPGESGPVEYAAGVGYDLATGLGSINAGNLVNAFDSIGGRYGDASFLYASAVSASSPTEIQITFGGTVTPEFKLRYGVEFQITASSCGANPIYAGNCTVQVQFNPGYPGVRRDALIASTRDGQQIVPLWGLGNAPQATLIPGAISTIAGNGQSGFSGDGGSAVNAALNQPASVALDSIGNVYIADRANNVIRKVDAVTGLITTVAGTGVSGYGGDGGPATQAQLNQPQGVAVDGSGSIYIADTGNSVVRRVNGITGEITTIAGNGVYGQITNNDLGLALQSSFGAPVAIALDPGGNVYICDSAFSTVWVVYGQEMILLTGTGKAGYSGDGGIPIAASLNHPASIAIDSNNNVYIADTGNNVIRKVIPASYEFAGLISTIAGNGTAGYTSDFGPATHANLNKPVGVAVDAAGDIYISEASNNLVRVVNAATGTIATVAGNRSLTASSGDGGPATSAGLDSPKALALDGATNLFVSTAANVVRKVSATQGSLNFATTPAGGASPPQTALVLNSGIAALTLSGITIPSGFTEVTPPLTQCSNAGNLTGTLCAISLEATPSSSTNPIGAVTLTDNNVNTPNSQQQILLNAPAIAPDSWLIHIGVPTSADGPMQGQVIFYGYAFNTTSVITRIQIAIDGATVGQASYGIYRPDVCAIYPGEPGCPNVGWSFLYNTQLLANGAHLLQVTATAADGSHSVTASSFNVANWSTANPTHIDFASPGPRGTIFSGSASFGGWVVDDDAPVANVAVSIDGVPAGNAFYGIYRADVCAVYTGRAGCPNVGWGFTYDTTALADGQHTIQLIVTAEDRKSTASALFTVANGARANTTTRPVHVDIDNPSPQTGPLSGDATLSGWAIDDASAISNVAISVDGTVIGNASYGASRPDVCAVFPGRAGCPNVGWSYRLDTTRLANGAHTLSILASGANSRSAVSTVFTVNNGSGAFHLNIGSPNGPSEPVTGLFPAFGWALNDTGAITSITYAIDGIPSGTANYGVYRADVCALFPGSPGCPTVGWNFTFDSTQLTDGQHTLAVTAYSGGASATFERTFTVANWSSANPILLGIHAPAQNATVSGVTALSGWAFDSAERVAQVTYGVDGAPLGAAAYGIYRADVCVAYSNPPGCPSVGWTASLDTTSLTNGSHTLDITVTSVSGISYTQSEPFVVQN